MPQGLGQGHGPYNGPVHGAVLGLGHALPPVFLGSGRWDGLCGESLPGVAGLRGSGENRGDRAHCCQADSPLPPQPPICLRPPDAGHVGFSLPGGGGGGKTGEGGSGKGLN